MIEALHCAHHPGRPGAARCMSCSLTVCVECTTTWEGIHHCVRCLAAKRTAAKPRARAAHAIVWLVVTALLLAAAAWLLPRGAVTLAG